MLGDFLYNEIQNILSVLKQSDNLNTDVNDDIIDALALLRRALCRLDARDPIPQLTDLAAIYSSDLDAWLTRTITRSDSY